MKFQCFNNKNCETSEMDSGSDFESEERNLNNQNLLDPDVLSIEGLRRTYNSCSNCGVCWYQDHISLDCQECGGYAMCRPCPTCNGQCGSIWRRDVKASRTNKNAQWHGTCNRNTQWQNQNRTDPKLDRNANFHSAYCLPQTMTNKTCVL